MYPSIPQILIVLVILLLLFGHKRIREFGKALGEGLRDFKKGLEGKTDTSNPTKENNTVKSSTTSDNSSENPSDPKASSSKQH